MTEQALTLEEWHRLYQAAARLKELAPWEWMTEEEIFGVQDPDTRQLGFVSVMGMLGEHLAVAVYLGPLALYSFWNMVRSSRSAPPEQILEIAQLQASFEDRNTLRDEDRALIKQLGLKFRGAQAWPMFRSYRPGCFPWHVEADEARLLTHALEQTLDVTARVKQDRTLLRTSNNVSYLVRVPRQQDGQLAWEDQILEVLPPEPEPIPLSMDMGALESLKRLPPSPHIVEADLFMFPSPVQEKKGERPVFPYNLMMVDADSGFILCAELLTPVPSLEAMWGNVPMTVARQLAAAGIVPREIRVRSQLLYQLLQQLGQELGIEVRLSHTTRSLNRAKRALSRFGNLGLG